MGRSGDELRDRSERPPPLPPEPSEAHFVHGGPPWRPHGRVFRALRTTAAVLGTGATFALAVAGGTVLHVGLPPSRRLIASAVNQILDGTFRGKIAIARIGSLRANRIAGVDAILSTHEGKRVARLQGVQARVALGPLLWSVIRGKDLRLDVTDLTIEDAEALLESAANGDLEIADVFEPAQEGPPPPPDKSSGSIDLSLSKIALRHAWVHGTLASVPVIDADLADLDARFEMNAARTAVDVRRLRLNTRGLPSRQDLAAQLEAHLVLPVEHPDDARSASLSFVGRVGQADVNLTGKLDGAAAQAALHAAVGPGVVDLNAAGALPTDARPDGEGTLTVHARDVDARAFQGPASKVGVDVAVGARFNGAGMVRGSYDVRLLPGAVAAQQTPEATIRGEFTDNQVLGSAHVAEAGAPIDLHYEVGLAAPHGPDIDFDVSTRAKDLQEIPQLRGALQGSAVVRATGRASLGTQTVRAKVGADLSSLRAGSISANHAAIAATVGGTFTAPRFGLNVTGRNLVLPSFEFPTFAASATGDLGEARVGLALDGVKSPSVKLSASVAAAKAIAVRDLSMIVSRAKDAVSLRADSIKVDGSNVDATGIRLDGAGEPLTAEAHLRPGSLRAQANSAGLDLSTFARLAQGEHAEEKGKLALDVDLAATPRSTKGHLSLDATDVSDGKEVQKLAAKVAATFSGRDADLDVSVDDPRLGALEVKTENVHLAAGALEPRAWTGATGKARARLDMDLAKVTAGAPAELPIRDATGRVRARFDVTRDDPHHRPALALHLVTEKLSFSTVPDEIDNGDGTDTIIGKPFHTQDLDAHVVATLDGESGDTTLDADLHDKVGSLLAFKAATKLPVVQMLAGRAKEALLATNVTLHAAVPMRSLDSLPPMLGTLPIRGAVGFNLDVSGTALEPQVHAEVQAKDLLDADDPTPIPIDLDAKLAYDGSTARLDATAATKQAGKVMDASAVLNVSASEALQGDGAPAWEANADVKLHELPIGAVADFVDQAIDGNVSGEVSLHDLHRAGALDAKLDLDHLVVSNAQFSSAHATATVRDGIAKAAMRIDQPDQGFADLAANAAITWGAEIAPALDTTKPLAVKFKAKNFRAAAAAPFLQGSVSELDGLINADTTLHIKPGFKDGSMEGAILVDKGRFDSPAVGEEFHDLKARIFMKPWGQWNVSELSARGTSGRFSASAFAKVDGFHLLGGEAHLRIPQGDKLPLTLQGSALGNAYGAIDATATMSKNGKELAIDVKVPDFHVDLEDAVAHPVQSTDPNPTIRVGVHGKDGRLDLLPYDGTKPLPQKPVEKEAPTTPPLAIHLTTHLGPDLEIRRGTMLRVYVTSGPVVDVGAETRISGAINLPRGYVELQGKRFQIEKGTVNFTGQTPDNPVVIATASYEAADGTKVFADFVGPVKTGKLTLRSEPALGQNEILALLLFGSADGTFGQSAPPSQQGNTGTQAASLAGGVVTEGLNKAISGISGVDVQTKVDTSENGDPRPEVEVALSRKVSATVIYNLGVPPPGQNPDDTLLMVDWRFHKNYSTEATLGDRGTTILDLAWKYRY